VARLRLLRAMATETRTRPIATDTVDRAVPADRDRVEDAFAITPAGEGKEGPLRAALDAYRALSADEAVGAEAAIRAAFIWHRLGNQARALEAVDRGLAASRDPVVSYWGQLVRGRVLAATNRLADSTAAYRQAAALVPGAQTPAVALAALALVDGDRDGAEHWASTARTGTGGDARDPWWLYWFGDVRMLDALVASMREPRP
jgi:hypothetical protein